MGERTCLAVLMYRAGGIHTVIRSLDVLAVRTVVDVFGLWSVVCSLV